MTENEAAGAAVLEPVQVEQPAETNDAPAEAVVEPTPDAGAAPEEQDAEGEKGEEDKPKKKGGFQRQIEKESRLRYEAEFKAQNLERELNELKRKTQPEPGEKPKIDAFSSIEDYDKALIDWAKRGGVEEGYKKARDESLQQTEERKRLEIQASVARRADIARVKHIDFDAVVQPLRARIESIPAVTKYVVENEPGLEVVYALAKDPERLLKIADMTETQALRELFDLERKLTAPAPPKKLTNAPDPIKTVGANEKVAKSLADMTMDEYVRARREERRKTKG